MASCDINDVAKDNAPEGTGDARAHDVMFWWNHRQNAVVLHLALNGMGENTLFRGNSNDDDQRQNV